MKKTISFTFLQVIICFVLEIHAQNCQNPFIACSAFNNSTLTQCGTSFSYAATALNNPCVQGTINTRYGCVTYTPQNQTWFIITVTNGTGQDLNFEFTNSTNQDINGVIWGPTNSDLSHACFQITGYPASCDFDSGNPNLKIHDAMTGATYIMMLSNHSGNATNVNISQPTGGGTVQFCRFTPNNTTCQLPTATFSSDKTVLSGTEVKTELLFTGTPPFYYTLGSGAYEYTSETTYSSYTTYPNESYELAMPSVRNSCGYGTVIKDTFALKILEKDTVLRSCYLFNNSFTDGVSANHPIVNGATFTEDRNQVANQALSFDGIDDYLGMMGRDYPAEQYTLAAWVYISNLPANGSIQKILSIGAGNEEQFLGIANNSQTSNQSKWIVGGKCLNGVSRTATAPATTNQWVHLCSVKTKDSLRIYINGVQYTRVLLEHYPSYTNNPIARIGCSVSGSNFFKGKIDDVKIFSGALKNKHIKDLFNSTDCSFRLCNNIPIATITPSTTIWENDKIYRSLRANVTATSQDYYYISIGKEMPIRKSNLSYPYEYHDYFFNSDSARVGYYKISHLSGLCGTGIVTNQAKVVFTPIIKSCFSFNGNTRNEARASHGYSNGAILTTDRFGASNSAYSFNGNASINLGYTNTSVLANSHTISAWINVTAFTQSPQMTIFAGGMSGSDNALMIFKNGNETTLRYMSFSENNFTEVPINITFNQWMHVAVTNVRGKVFLYLNGQLIHTEFVIPGDDWFSTSTIGSRTAVPLNGFYGKIDDVKVFSGTLSSTQILELYQSVDCDYRPCNEKPKGSIIGVSDAPYGQYGYLQLKFEGAGDWTYTMENDYGSNMFTTDNENAVYNFLPSNSTPTSFKLTSVQNACGYGEASGKVALNVIPKTQNCYLLNNDAANSTGNYEGTLYNTISTSDRFNDSNSAFEFNGTSSFIDIPITGLLNPEYSISMWVMPYNQTNSVSKVISLGTQSQNQKLAYYFDNSQNSWVWTFASSASQASSTIKSSRGIAQNQWHHIVLTRNYQKQQLYIDGVLVAENLISDFPNYGYPSCIFIGKGHDLGDAFTGKIDEVKFFKGILNSSEVRSIFNSFSSSCTFTACPNLKISEGNINGIKLIESGKTITSNSSILLNSEVTFDSGGEIILSPGFKVENGGVFKAIIDGCGNN